MMKGFKKGAQCDPGLVKHGEAMGFKKGGKVTSGEFVMKTEKQSSMDHGNMPANKGDNEQEKEAGGRKKLRPGYMAGGKVASKAHKTHGQPKKSQGRGKKPVGRGKKAVGKGGETGKHKSGRIKRTG